MSLASYLANMEDDSIIESRKELMVSPSNGRDPTLRTAHLLKPCITNSTPLDFLPPHFPDTVTSHAKLSPEIRYNGWQIPPKEWITWVTKLRPKFEYLWIKAGIDAAIQASTYEIKRYDDLILELAHRWCSITNTFVFPWGESTITLEDTRFCFGYCILGDPVSSPVVNDEETEAEEELIEARRMFNRTKAKKVAQTPWMLYFMENESKVEHEAFLVYWLSRFVFPAKASKVIVKSVIPIAIHLARGNRIALAPAVLASIYRDLSLLKSTINSNNTDLTVTLCAPFQLVQIWALERFPALETHTYTTRYARVQPRVARWRGLTMQKHKNLKLMLDSAVERNRFLWRPYENSPSLKVYNEKDMWECDNPCLDEELQSFARCLRVCELEGMGCKEKYHPHRVAMQFGMDQDIPAVVSGSNKDPWMSYSQPVNIMDLALCMPLCSSQPGVTARYYCWWNQSKTSVEGDTKVKVEESYNNSPPGFTSKFESDQVAASDKEDYFSVIEPSSSSSEAKCCDEEVVENDKASSSPQSGEEDHLSVIELSSSLSEAKCYDGEVVGNGKASSSPQSGGVFPSSSVGNEANIKSQFCNRNGVNDISGEGVIPSTLDMAFDLEKRIEKLERVIAKLKAERFGPKAEGTRLQAVVFLLCKSWEYLS